MAFITRYHRLQNACAMIEAEADRAQDKFPPFNSAHEGYAVLLEEVDEAWEAIRKNDLGAAVAEMIQVGAMAARFVAEMTERREAENPMPGRCGVTFPTNQGPRRCTGNAGHKSAYHIFHGEEGQSNA